MIHLPGIQTTLLSSLKVVLQRFIQMSTNEDSVVLLDLLSVLVNDTLLDIYLPLS